MSKAILVNERDEVLGYKDREAQGADDIFRVSAAWLFNSQNEVLIAKRVKATSYDPGKWSLSVSGTLEEGETYSSNIVKETEEELGVVCEEKDLVLGPKFLNSVRQKYFCQVYFLKADMSLAEFSIFEEEVGEIKWISLSELHDWFHERPEDFIVSFKFCLQDVESFLARDPK